MNGRVPKEAISEEDDEKAMTLETISYTNIATCYLKLNDPRKAIEFCSKAMVYLYIYMYAYTYIYIHILDLLIDLSYPSGGGNASKYCYLKLNDPRKALEFCSKAMVLSSTIYLCIYVCLYIYIYTCMCIYTIPYTNIATCYLKLNDPRKALEFCSKAMVLSI
jgi:tetratricopeptide (TPR) repeat protein